MKVLVSFAECHSAFVCSNCGSAGLQVKLSLKFYGTGVGQRSHI